MTSSPPYPPNGGWLLSWLDLLAARASTRLAFPRVPWQASHSEVSQARARTVMMGRSITNQEGQDGAGHCEVVQRRQGLRFHRRRGGPRRVRALQRDHGWRLPQSRGGPEGRIRHDSGPEGTSGGQRQRHRLRHLRGGVTWLSLTTSVPPVTSLRRPTCYLIWCTFCMPSDDVN